jgi:hypothetical protein
MVFLPLTARGLYAARLLLLCLVCIASDGITCTAKEQQHPDLLGLLALKASICADSCKELSSWNATSNPCTWEGVYCGYLSGEWRAVSINLQLDAKSVLLNDSALSEKGVEVLQLPHVRELELLCMKSDRPIGEWRGVRPSRPHTQVCTASAKLQCTAALTTVPPCQSLLRRTWQAIRMQGSMRFRHSVSAGLQDSTIQCRVNTAHIAQVLIIVIYLKGCHKSHLLYACLLSPCVLFRTHSQQCTADVVWHKRSSSGSGSAATAAGVQQCSRQQDSVDAFAAAAPAAAQ